MTQQPYYPPQQAQQYPQQAYPPQYPQAPAQPTFPPQQAQQPYQQQGYPPPAPPQQAQQPYQQQGYPPPAPPQPSQPLAQGTIDDFYNQPSSGGGASLKFPQVGTRYVGIVTRPIGPGDVQQQTNTQGIPLFFKDGRPKWVMKVPLQMQPSQQYPDGLAQWYVKGAARDELVRAMAEAGAPEGPPEQGAVLDITFSSTRSAGTGMNDAKLFTVRYTRPQGSEQGQQHAAPQGADAPSPAPAPQAPPQAAPPVQEQQYQQPQGQQYPPQAPAPQQYEQPVPQQQAPAAPQPPSDLSAEQQALLARLTGQQG